MVFRLDKDISICNHGVHSDYFTGPRKTRCSARRSFVPSLLLIYIKTNNNIRGISIGGETEIKVLHYADDTAGALKDDCSLRNILDVRSINSFEKI